MASLQPEHAANLNRFYRDSFNFYLNFHRPSAQPEVVVAANRKLKTIYKRWPRRGKYFA